MSQAPQTDESSKTDAQSDEAKADAHLSQLHRMSTTAGVTNLDYVAVNLTSIFAILLGMFSALAFLSWMLLPIAVAAIIFAIIAIRQINNSGGTQTGKWLAIIGLLLSLLLGGGAAVKEIMGVMALRTDEQQVAETLAQAGKFIREGKYTEAYALFDDNTFHSYVRPEQFKNTWIAIQTPPPRGYGALQTMDGNGIVQFESAGGTRIAITKAKMQFTNTQDDRYDITLRETGGKWRIFRFPSFFPEPKRFDFNID